MNKAAALCGLLLLVLLSADSPGQSAAAGQAEAQKCVERIEAVQRDLLGKYDDALLELQNGLQKSADLEGALAVRAERERLKTEQSLSEKDFASDPKALRNLQAQTSTRLRDLLAQLVADTVPKLVELKKQLTVAGKLDDALAIRGAIENLQNAYLPAVRIESGSVVAADTLVAAYNADRSRADKVYKGQKFIVHGAVGGFRADPADTKSYQLFVTGGSSGGWVQCSLAGPDHRFREEKGPYNVPILVITSKDGDTARVQKGSALDVRGTCDGWDDAVKLSRCELVR